MRAPSSPISKRSTALLIALAPLAMLFASQMDSNRTCMAEEPSVQHASALQVNWPHWRGPKFDGISTESGWTTDWPSDGPVQLWEKEVGTGFSSFSVVGNRVYTIGNHEKPKEEGAEEDPAKIDKNSVVGIDTIYCLDAETGKEIWTCKYDCILLPNMHEGGPASTPTIDGDELFVVSKQGHLTCVDLQDGNIKWQKRMDQDLDTQMPMWGFSCSPLIVGDFVIVDAGRTAAYDRKSGEVVWKTDPYAPGYGSPVPFEFKLPGGKTKQYIAVLNNSVLMIIDPKDGSEITSRKWTTQFDTSACTPLVVGNKIFISTGYNRGCLLVEFDGKEFTDIYENKEMRNHMNNCVLWEGCLYGFDGNAKGTSRNVTLRCLDFEEGTLIWEEKGLGCGSLMIADGKLVCLSESGELVIAKPNKESYDAIAKASILEGKCWTVPVLSGGKVFARNAAGHLVCVDLRQK